MIFQIYMYIIYTPNQKYNIQKTPAELQSLHTKSLRATFVRCIFIVERSYKAPQN